MQVKAYVLLAQIDILKCGEAKVNEALKSVSHPTEESTCLKGEVTRFTLPVRLPATAQLLSFRCGLGLAMNNGGSEQKEAKNDIQNWLSGKKTKEIRRTKYRVSEIKVDPFH